MGKKRRRMHSPKFINHPSNKWGTTTDTTTTTEDVVTTIPETVVTPTPEPVVIATPEPVETTTTTHGWISLLATTTPSPPTAMISKMRRSSYRWPPLGRALVRMRGRVA